MEFAAARQYHCMTRISRTETSTVHVLVGQHYFFFCVYCNLMAIMLRNRNIHRIRDKIMAKLTHASQANTFPCLIEDRNVKWNLEGLLFLYSLHCMRFRSRKKQWRWRGEGGEKGGGEEGCLLSKIANLTYFSSKEKNLNISSCTSIIESFNWYTSK